MIGLVGAGDQARETAGYLAAAGISVPWHAVNEEYLDAARADDRLGAAVLPFAEADAGVQVLIALGYPGDRRDMARRWPGEAFATHVSGAAWVAPGVALGEGTVVCPGAVVTAGTAIGRHVLVNIGATVSHDCRAGDFVTISPGAHVAGRVTVADGVFVGVGAVVSDGVTLGEGCLVGAGAVVVEDVSPGAVVAGVPARVLRTLADWPRA